MTGHGQAQVSDDAVSVWCEIRAVNNRFLKVSFSSNDRVAELESQVKSVIQSKIRRGSVHVQLEIQSREPTSRFKINANVLKSYQEQMRSLQYDVSPDKLIELPGVVEELVAPSAGNNEMAANWPVIESALEAAIGKLIEMRQQEGQSMAHDLLSNCDQIRVYLAKIEQRSPQVIAEYSSRLTERINQLLAPHDTAITPSEVIKEVGVFAEKCDISEETVRLRTHLDQFSEIVNSSQSDGRKLEFVTQEMLRETNTIGSKANDAEIAHCVVEIKTAIERIREMTQNIE